MKQLGFALSFLILLAVGGLSYRSLMDAMATVQWVAHSHQVLESLNRVSADLLRAESSRRGLVLTGGDERLVEHHRAARESLERHLAQLAGLTSDNPVQAARVRSLERAALAKVAYTVEALDHLRANPADRDWQVETTVTRGVPLMAEVTRLVIELRAAEENLLAGRTASATTSVRRTQLVIVLGTATALGLLLWTSRRLSREMAERRRAEEALQVKEEQVRLAVAAAGVGTWHWDLRSGEIYWSDTMKELFGITSEMPLEVFVERLHPDDRERVKGEVGRAVDNGTDYDTEYRLLRPDGTLRWIAARGRARFEAGRAVLMQGVVLDMTPRRRADEQLRLLNDELREQSRKALEATRLKSEFLANMSHELRTPLNAVVGFGELLHDGRVGPVSDEQKECLSDILTSARHLLRLINDILDLSKVEAGRMEFHPEPTDPAAVVAEVCDIVRSLAARKRIVIGVETDSTLGPVVVDPIKLKQILYNYVSNALKFTPDGGRVTVRVRPEGSADFRVEVEDDGVGVRPEDMGRLFVEFQQLDSGSGKKHEGTGLGLALTKRIVEAQGGRVGAESSGKGSLFYAVLPRGSRDAVPSSTAPPTPSVSLPPARTVLVVEDDATEREWLRQALESDGYSVEAVATGHQALERCRQRPYEAITLDLILPDMNGWDVLQAIRGGGPNRLTPVVVLSVLSEKEVGKAFRIDDYLVKPADSSELLAVLKRAQAGRAAAGPVLVVDDDPQILRLCQRTLHDAGYRSVCCPDGESALAAAEREPPSAVVLDLLMPGIDGFEFLDRFRRMPAAVEAPVIVWTNKDVTAEDRKRLHEGARQVVLKSQGGVPRLLEELRAHLGRPSASGQG